MPSNAPQHDRKFHLLWNPTCICSTVPHLVPKKICTFKNYSIAASVFFQDPLEMEEGQGICNKTSNSEFIAVEEINDFPVEVEDLIVNEVKKPHSKSKKRSVVQHLSAAVKELSQLNKNISSAFPLPTATLTTEDECDVIGRHIAIQLRKLPAEDLMNANLEIQHILAKYRKINTPSAGPRSSSAAHQASSVLLSPLHIDTNNKNSQCI